MGEARRRKLLGLPPRNESRQEPPHEYNERQVAFLLTAPLVEILANGSPTGAFRSHPSKAKEARSFASKAQRRLVRSLDGAENPCSARGLELRLAEKVLADRKPQRRSKRLREVENHVAGQARILQRWQSRRKVGAAREIAQRMTAQTMVIEGIDAIPPSFGEVLATAEIIAPPEQP